MLKKSLLLGGWCWLVLAGSIAATPAVRFAVEVSQADSLTGKQVLLKRDTVEVVKGINATGCFLAFTLELGVTAVDSSSALFDVHVNTFGEQPHNYAQRFQAEFGLPAWVPGIQGKAGAEYRLTLTPLEAVEVDTNGCGFVHRRSGDFSFEPSAYFDLYYVPNSLADLFWNGLKGLLDAEYRKFSRFNRYSLPGKYAVYACPCEVRSVLWDDRFRMMVDPTRMAVFGVYNRELNSMDPFLLAHASVQRHYGYAPPVLSEGFAGYFSLPAYEVRKLKKAGPLMPLDSLLDTYQFLSISPMAADRISAAFTKYLIDAYGIDSFLSLYRAAHDLNVREELTRAYGKPVAELEIEFNRYVDTVTWSSADVVNAHELSRAMMNPAKALEFARENVRVAVGNVDSANAWRRVARSAFEAGDYYTAIEAQRTLCRMDTAVVANMFTLASNLMMVGEYSEADAWLDSAAVRDSSNQLVRFSRALGFLSTGRLAEARQVFEGIVARPQGMGGLTESRILMAHLLLQTGVEADEREAHNLAIMALDELGAVQVQRGESSYRMLWLGMAHLAQGDTDTAWEMLQSGLFMENRPFYVGMLNLWLGKVSDVRGERDVARAFYGQVVTGAAADYHQREARRYLESPYTQ